MFLVFFSGTVIYQNVIEINLTQIVETFEQDHIDILLSKTGTVCQTKKQNLIFVNSQNGDENNEFLFFGYIRNLLNAVVMFNRIKCLQFIIFPKISFN